MKIVLRVTRFSVLINLLGIICHEWSEGLSWVCVHPYKRWETALMKRSGDNVPVFRIL